jgi:membrane fusion protein, multidrug efflux system
VLRAASSLAAANRAGEEFHCRYKGRMALLPGMSRPTTTLVALLWSLGACGQGGSKIPPRPPPMVVVNVVKVRDVKVTVKAPIDLRPLTQVDVGSKTLGYLDLVLVDRGDVVKKGQLLALVRPSDLPQQLATAKSALAQIQANKLLARTNFERAKRLAPAGVVSQQELQSTAAALAAAEASEAASKSQIVAYAVRLGETRIESPIDGVVAVRRLDPGALVGPPGGGAIVTVVRMDTLRVFISVNEQYAARIAIGQETEIELDAVPGEVIRGQVVRLAPAFDPTTRTLDAEVHLRNKRGLLRPGMYGRGAIVLETHAGAVVVPVSAVQISRQQQYVFIVKGNQVFQRPVKTGVDGDEWLEVTSGLEPGARVVTAGAEGLSDGAVVRTAEGIDPYTGSKPAAQAAVKP